MKELSINSLCRLCLKNSNFFSNIYKDQSMEEFLVYELVNDVCDLDISVDDGLPEFLCGVCFGKILEFKSFKAYTHKGRSALLLLKERMENPVIKQEELDISGDEYEEPFNGTNSEQGFGPIILKNEMLTVYGDRHQQELIESETSENVGAVELPAASMEDCTQPVIKQEELDIDCTSVDENEEPFKGFDSEDNIDTLKLEPEEEDIDSSEIELPLEETVTHPEYPNCLENKRKHFTSKGEGVADSCTWRICTNEKLIFEKTKNISLSEEVEASSSETMERLEYQRFLPGESMDMASLVQQEKERVMMEQDLGGDASRGTGLENGARERREGFECFHCGNVLTSKLGLIRHMKVHGFFNSYDCAECGKVFRFNYQFKMHLLTHTGAKPHKCAECSKSFSQSSSLKTHMILHTGIKPYKCEQCGKCFSFNGNLTTHMRIHTGSKPYKCAECGKCFSQYSTLKTHIRLHTGFKPYKCSDCSKSFSIFSNLKSHIRMHTGSKPYKCVECSKSFSQSSNLKKHIRSHSGSKPYKCDECSKIFSQSYNLKRHMRTHTGSKPYKCDKCSKIFSKNCNLKRHMRTHIGSKPCKCA